MDGSDRRTIVTSNLSLPIGITIDYVSERIYWTDLDLKKIEYANYNGTERMSVDTSNTGPLLPFALTVAGNIIFCSNLNGHIYAMHKDHGANSIQGFFYSIAHFSTVFPPYGIEALKSDRQPSGNDNLK